MAIMNVGAPACGMNAAIRSFVRMSLTAGIHVFGVHYGMEGLLQEQVSLGAFYASACLLVPITIFCFCG